MEIIYKSRERYLIIRKKFNLSGYTFIIRGSQFIKSNIRSDNNCKYYQLQKHDISAGKQKTK